MVVTVLETILAYLPEYVVARGAELHGTGGFLLQLATRCPVGEELETCTLYTLELTYS
jgi:hypothetical protein